MPCDLQNSWVMHQRWADPVTLIRCKCHHVTNSSSDQVIKFGGGRGDRQNRCEKMHQRWVDPASLIRCNKVNTCSEGYCRRDHHSQDHCQDLCIVSHGKNVGFNSWPQLQTARVISLPGTGYVDVGGTDAGETDGRGDTWERVHIRASFQGACNFNILSRCPLFWSPWSSHPTLKVYLFPSYLPPTVHIHYIFSKHVIFTPE